MYAVVSVEHYLIREFYFQVSSQDHILEGIFCFEFIFSVIKIIKLILCFAWFRVHVDVAVL